MLNSYFAYFQWLDFSPSCSDTDKFQGVFSTLTSLLGVDTDKTEHRLQKQTALCAVVMRGVVRDIESPY